MIHWNLIWTFFSAGFDCARAFQPGIYHDVQKTSKWIQSIIYNNWERNSLRIKNSYFLSHKGLIWLAVKCTIIIFHSVNAVTSTKLLQCNHLCKFEIIIGRENVGVFNSIYLSFFLAYYRLYVCVTWRQLRHYFIAVDFPICHIHSIDGLVTKLTLTEF